MIELAGKEEQTFDGLIALLEALHRQYPADEMTMPEIEELPHTPVDL